MKKQIRLFMAFIAMFLLLPINTSYADILYTEYLDIRLTRTLPKTNTIKMESINGFSLYYNNDKDNILLVINESIVVATLGNNGCIDIRDSQNNLIYALPGDGSILIGSNEPENPKIMIEKNRYRDYIKLLNKKSEIFVINHIQVENYLYGLVPREMPATFHMEALKAQAVAARSYALFSIKKHAVDGYNLCDSTHCQVYSGFDGENPATNLAVDETSGILACYDGNIIDAQYHSSSSGYTEDSINVWGGDLPYLKSVEDSFSSESPHSTWTTTINLLDLGNKLMASGINLGTIKRIEILGTTASGKVSDVKIIGNFGEQNITATKLRNMVGSTIFKSAWFNIKGELDYTSSKKVYVIDAKNIKPQAIDLNNAYVLNGINQKKTTRGAVNRARGKDGLESIGGVGSVGSYPISTTEIVIEGKGFGHGVGMSQFGAKKMAEIGYTYEEILKHYYTGINLMNINQ